MQKTMNKFIGGRYLPLHDGEHDKTKEYSPLTVVTKAGNSYTSKTYVPRGIEVENATYWALTGEYNMQIATLRESIAEIGRKILGLETFVTPEMYGAVGDGITDDSRAFIQALNDCRVIKCKNNAKYYVKEKLVIPNKQVYIDGNGCEFIDLQIDINSSDGSQWNDQYQSLESIIGNFKVTHKTKDYCIGAFGATKLTNIFVVDYPLFAKRGPHYIDYFTADNITHFMSNQTRDYITFQLNGLGDKTILERCHNAKVYARCCNTLTLHQCLNGGVEAIDSYIIVKDGHMEGFEWVGKNSKILFDCCFFWSNVPLIEDATYRDCTFFNSTKLDGKINNHTNDFTKINGRGNEIWTNRSTGVSYEHGRVKLDEYKRKDFKPSMKYLYGKQFSYNSNNGGKFFGESGEYTYHFYASISPTEINGYNNEKTKLTHTVAIDERSPLFIAEMELKGSFIHVYREHSGKIMKAVIPQHYMIHDNGENLLGILWQEVDSLPEVIDDTRAELVNGMYVSNKELNGTGFIKVNPDTKTVTWQ